MKSNSKELCQKCEQCQRYAHIPQRPSSFPHCMSSPWPFTQWGVDVVGQLKQSTGQKRNVIVACDYFTKWLEVEAVSEVTEKKVKGFIYNNILCRFGVPHTLIMEMECNSIAKAQLIFARNMELLHVLHPSHTHNLLDKLKLSTKQSKRASRSDVIDLE